jgi:hypothetical protein
MKNTLLIKISVSLLGLLLICGISMAQTSITTTNSQNRTLIDGTTAPVAATETPDLVTKGTLVPYLVVPDAALNPSYILATDKTSTANVVSSFTWTTAGIGAITNTGYKHYIELDITGNVSATPLTMNVKEQSGASCPDATGTDISIRIIAQPDATGASVTDGTGDASVCASGTNGSLNVVFPTFKVTPSLDAAISSSTPNVKVKATLAFTPLNGTSSTIFTNQVLSVDASGNISNTDLATASGLTDFDSWGTYTLTVNYVSDKISRKDIRTGNTDANLDNGYFAPTTAISSAYTVLKTPTTGPIYHISNTGL